ncbi:hypothetical protein FNF31_03033 [Cafeteria roenbergensis]|uniref:Uncharacterized protein n=1 Tax=Cafeteria roenbergensis TaxID=33653 RepID=A0A5A8DEE8_CAFRO|nr:hypothetical protein FNF31_03033 [Cafeteria roenbergensis]
MRNGSAGGGTPGCWGSGRGTGPGDPATEPEAAKHAEALLADLELAYGPVRLAAAVHMTTGKFLFSREGTASGLGLPLGRKALADAAAADRAVETAVAAAATDALGVECEPVRAAAPAAEYVSRTGSLPQTSWRALSAEGNKAVSAALSLWRAAEAAQRAAKAVPSALDEEVARGAGVPIGGGPPDSPSGSEAGKLGGSFRDAWAGSHAVASIEVIDESESDVAERADETGGSKGAEEDRAGFGPDGASAAGSADGAGDGQGSAAGGGGLHRTASGRDAGAGGAGTPDSVPIRVGLPHQAPAGPTVAASSLRAALRPVSTAAARAAQRMLRPGCDSAPSPGSAGSSGAAGRLARASSPSTSPADAAPGGAASRSVAGAGTGGGAGAASSAHPQLSSGGALQTSSGSGESSDEPEGAVVVRSVGCDVSVLCLPLPAPADKVVLVLVVSRGPRGQWGGAGLRELVSECDAGGSILGDAQWQRARALGAMLALGIGAFREAVTVRAEDTEVVVPLQRGRQGRLSGQAPPLSPADRAVAAAVFNAADAATAAVRAWLAVAVAGLTMVPKAAAEPPGAGGCGGCCTVS